MEGTDAQDTVLPYRLRRAERCDATEPPLLVLCCQFKHLQSGRENSFSLGLSPPAGRDWEGFKEEAFMLALQEPGGQIKGACSEEECQSRTAGALRWESGRYNCELYPENPQPTSPCPLPP